MANPRISESIWRERVAQWRASGQSIKVYAEQSNFPAARLSFWARRVEREAHPVQLVPVRPQQPPMTAELELRGPSGWTLRVGAGCEPNWLAAVMSGLR